MDKTKTNRRHPMDDNLLPASLDKNLWLPLAERLLELTSQEPDQYRPEAVRLRRAAREMIRVLAPERVTAAGQIRRLQPREQMDLFRKAGREPNDGSPPREPASLADTR
jgi:hypothetical protein